MKKRGRKLAAKGSLLKKENFLSKVDISNIN